MSRMVGPSRLLRKVFFEPLLSATKDSSMVLTIYSYTAEQMEEADERTISLWWKVGHLYSPHVRHSLTDRFISPFCSRHLSTGGGFSFAFWSECIIVLMEGIQVSKPYWTCQTGIKGLVCIYALGFHLELCVYVCHCIQILRGYIHCLGQIVQYIIKLFDAGPSNMIPLREATSLKYIGRKYIL